MRPLIVVGAAGGWRQSICARTQASSRESDTCHVSAAVRRLKRTTRRSFPAPASLTIRQRDTTTSLGAHVGRYEWAPLQLAAMRRASSFGPSGDDETACALRDG